MSAPKPGICAKPEEITAAYLTEVLAYAGHSGSVKAFEADNVGTGQVGQNVRFKLSYLGGADAADSGPASIVGKFASPDPVSRETGVGLNNYLREVRFYQDLLPSLDVNAPDLFFTDIDPETHDFILLMEDLHPAQQGDQLAGCSRAQVVTGLAQLARLHGPRWNDKTLDDFDWLSRSDAESVAMVCELYAGLLPGFKERYQHRLSAEFLEVGDRLGEHFERYLSPPNANETVVHGDFRLDNLLFGGRRDLVVVDWQSPVIGSGGQDLAYFIGTSLTPAERRGHERQLVEGYFRELSRYELGNYSVDDCWQDFRHFALAGWVMAVIASMIVGQTDRGDDMFMAMGTRSAQLALDVDSLAVLASG